MKTQRWFRRSLVGFAAAALAASGCTTFDVMNDRRVADGPRIQPSDRIYELEVRVVDRAGYPVDGVHTRIRGVRYLNAFRNLPQAEFYVSGLSGDSGEPGLVTFRFPAPSDPRAFDLYVRTTTEREVRDTRPYFGRFWMTGNHLGKKIDVQGMHSRIDFGRLELDDEGKASIEVAYVE